MPTDSSAILYDVFISYARRDANLGAAPLDSALKRVGMQLRKTLAIPLPKDSPYAEIASFVIIIHRANRVNGRDTIWRRH